MHPTAEEQELLVAVNNWPWWKRLPFKFCLGGAYLAMLFGVAYLLTR